MAAPDPWGTDAVGDTAPPPSGYMSDAEFRATMDSIYGAGNWTRTGGWRSQAREDQLRAEGAGTVAPGHISAHSLGSPDAPGAWDIQVKGETPAQAAARLRAAGLPVSQVYPEGAHGTQGAHLHIGMEPGVLHDPWGVAGGAAPDPWGVAGARPTPAPTQSASWSPPSFGELWSGLLDKAEKVGLAVMGNPLPLAAPIVKPIVSGAETAGADIVAGLGGLADVFNRAQLETAARGGSYGAVPGGVPMFVPTSPADVAAARAAVAGPPDRTVSTALAPTAERLREAGARLAPQNPNLAQRTLMGAGSFIPYVAAAPLGPAAEATLLGSQSFAQTYDEAKRAGASDADAQRYATEAAGVGAGIGALAGPEGELVRPLAAGIERPVAGALARTATEAGVGAGVGAEFQAGQNVVAQQYDPNRPLYAGVPEAALNLGLAAGGMHGIHEIAGISGTPTAAAAPGAEAGAPAPSPGATIEPMPETIAAAAYRGQGPAAPAAYEDARLAEGAPEPMMPRAIEDVAHLEQGAPGAIAGEAAPAGDVNRMMATASQMEQAGVTPTDTKEVAAAKLAAYRASLLKQLGGDMEELRARADALDVPHTEGMTFDELLGDVVSKAAQAKGYDEHAAARDERLIDGVLTPSEHDWLAGAEGRAPGEQRPAGEVAAPRGSEAPQPTAPIGNLELGKGAGGGGRGAEALPQGGALDPWGVAAATTPTAELRPEPGDLGAGEHYVATPAGNRVRARYEVVPAESLGQATGDLQNRDRSRGTTQTQVQDIVSHFDPTRLGESPETDRGAPVVGPDNVVEAGNGRMLALAKIYTDPKLASRAEAYRRFLAERGFDTAGIERPVLIRRRLTEMTPDQRRQFVHDNNTPATMALTAVERARTDAVKLDAHTLGLYRGGDVSSAANSDFVKAFIAKLAPAEQAGMVDADRRLSQEGVARIENALMARAYEHPQILAKLMESRDNNIRSIGAGMLDQAANWAKLRDAVRAGEVKPEFDVTQQLVAAAQRVSDARSRGEKIADVLGQHDMMNPMDPVTEGFIKAFYNPELTRAAGRDAIAEVLGTYVRRASEQTVGPKLVEDLTAPSPAGILQGALAARKESADNGALFERPVEEMPVEHGPKWERETPFYSAAARAIDNTATKAASPDQWKATLDNAQGVKKEELEWTGVKDWLDLFPKGEKVPKEAVQAFLRDHGVKVREVVLNHTGIDDIKPDAEAEAKYATEWARAVEENRKAFEGMLMSRERGNYELAGRLDAERQRTSDELDRLHRAMIDETLARQPRDLGEGTPAYEDWKERGGEDYHELLLTLPDVANPPSTHWDTEGVMAHVRFDTRRAPDGKKVLFVEEIQSDWHQKGRDQGYAAPASMAERSAAADAYEEATRAESAAAQKLVTATDEAIRSLIRRGVLGLGSDPERAIRQAQWNAGYNDRIDAAEGMRAARGEQAMWWIDRTPELGPAEKAIIDQPLAEFRAARLRNAEARQRYENAREGSGIANAPFKSSWPALVMKRVIAWAADHGFDRVAWTTGEQQNARYGLEKAIEYLRYKDNGNGTYRLSAQDHGGRGHMIGEAVTKDKLPEYVGAALAKKIVDGEGASENLAANNERPDLWRRLAGEDLKVGGSGMRQFYDRNLVNIANDLIKKYGAKVGKENIKLTDMPVSEYEKYPEGHPYREKNFPAVHAFDLTDKMREAATNGFPLFKREEAAPGALDLGETTAPHPEAAKLIADVHDIITRIAPKGVEPRAFGTMRDSEGYGVTGAAWREGAKHVIAWSLESADPEGTARHEALHALRALGLFKPEEWDALSHAALDKGWLDRYNIRERYGDFDPSIQLEEAIASRFGEWRRDKIGGADLPSFAKALFQRIANALGKVAGAVRKALGARVSAADVFRAIETGEVGQRAEAAGAAEQGAISAPDVRYQRADDDTRSTFNRILGSGVDAVGSRISRAARRFLPDPLIEMASHIRMGVNPMSAGSARAKSSAKDFANELREHRWEWNRVDEWLKKHFDRDQRQAMWQAADEESVIRQRGEEPLPGQGLSKLGPDERAAVEELQRRANAAFIEAKQLNMTSADPLPSYVPRMVVEMTREGARRVSSENPGAVGSGTGRNLTKTTGQLRQRKYLTTEETEAAAKEKFGEGATVIQDIRTLAAATGKLEQAIAGRRLIDQIKRAGQAVGEDLVSEGAVRDPSQVFTIDHPALKVWRPIFALNHETGKIEAVMDPNGKPAFEAKPLYISKEFEGPLKAVLSTPSNPIVRALMTLKGKTMSVIMYSPLMHNAVIWGKALPVMLEQRPDKALKSVLFFDMYRRGNVAKNDEAVMREALHAGLDPIGRRYFNQDITAIAEEPEIAPGRSWTAKLIGSIPGLFSKDAGIATKAAIDKLGDVWHNTFLWDRVADLQMGLYTTMRDSFVKQGLDPLTAQRVAAHYANRYAGAVPLEAMSKLARTTANLALFSRSFTLSNLGAWKDALVGLPGDVQAQIQRDAGLRTLQQAQGTARGKALALIAMDIALAHVGLMLASAAVWGIYQALNEPQPFQPPSENEPDRRNRFLIGYDADGTAIYGRLPTGKVAEDLVSWITEPLDTEERKESPYLRFISQLHGNDKGFGRKLYDPYDKTLPGDLRNLSRIVLGADVSNLNSPDDFSGGLLSDFAPVGVAQGTIHWARGQGDPRTSMLQTILPIFGITVSKGAPGGPAMGDLFRAQDEHSFQVAEAMPGIRARIRGGDIAGARTQMSRLGIAPGLQSYYIRTTINPAQRLTGRKLRDFLRYATPEDKAAFRADQQQSIARRQALESAEGNSQ